MSREPSFHLTRAVELVMRLGILEKFPKGQDGIDALAEALQTAPTEAAAVWFIRDWIKAHPKCPAPCDIYQKFESQSKLETVTQKFPPVAPGEEIPPPEYNCNLCEDTGWYIVQLKEKPWDSDQPYTAAKKCHHPLNHEGAKKRRLLEK